MQSQPAQNKLTEIAVIVIVALLIASGVFLLYVGKIDFSGILSMFGFAGAVLGINGALKAPSPAQQAQNNALFNQVMSVLPGLLAQSQQPITIHNNMPATPTVAQDNLVASSRAATPPAPMISPRDAFPVPQQAFPAPTLQPPSWTANVPAVTPGQP